MSDIQKINYNSDPIIFHKAYNEYAHEKNKERIIQNLYIKHGHCNKNNINIFKKTSENYVLSIVGVGKKEDINLDSKNIL